MLRILVFSLLLANIILVALRMLQPDAEETTVAGRTESAAAILPTIELAENVPENAAATATITPGSADRSSTLEQPAAESESTQFLRAEESMECIQVGPFKTEQSYASLRSELQELFDRVVARESKAIVDKGFWVYLPSYPTRSEAQDVIRDMSAAGAAEFYIVPEGSMANAISLGVYTRRERAEERRQQLNDLGLQLDVMIEPQTEIESSYWLEAGPVKMLNPALIELSLNNPDMQQSQVECSFEITTKPFSAAGDDLTEAAVPASEASGQN